MLSVQAARTAGNFIVALFAAVDLPTIWRLGDSIIRALHAEGKSLASGFFCRRRYLCETQLLL